MIKANELRLGNTINYRSEFTGEVRQRVVDIMVLKQLQSKHDIMRKGYEPIPLTEEWLIRFGFDNLGSYGWGIGYFHIRFRNIHQFYFLIENRIIRVKYVHQLQNLYYALTNEELKLVDTTGKSIKK